MKFILEVVESCDEQIKARLLHFVNGTCAVPSRGFAYPQRSNGSIRSFTIHGVTVEECMYARVHMCSNRMDLPVYDSKLELEVRLTRATRVSAFTSDFD